MSDENTEDLDPRIKNILDRYEFLSYGTMLDVSYLGIIQNSDAQLLSIYVLTDIPTHELRLEFLRFGELWWYGSNRNIPINLFIREFSVFRPYLKHFSRKDFMLIRGPAVSLAESIAKRVRKRQVILVRQPPT